MSSSNLSHILLLTGVPGIGKTTVIRKLATALLTQPGGFYTEEMRAAGRREGFRLLGFNHEQGIIAHVDIDHDYRVGKYGVDVAAIDYLADAALGIREETEVYLIDEIGKMECLSDVFVQRIQSLLESNKMLIATVAMKGGGLIAEVKRWPGSELWEITRTNRDTVPEKATAWLQERLCTSGD